MQTQARVEEEEEEDGQRRRGRREGVEVGAEE